MFRKTHLLRQSLILSTLLLSFTSVSFAEGQSSPTRSKGMETVTGPLFSKLNDYQNDTVDNDFVRGSCSGTRFYCSSIRTRNECINRGCFWSN